VKLCEALRVHKGDIVSIVGAGGKTSAMYRLSHELADLGWHVIATTTTMVRPPLPSQADALVVERDADRAKRRLGQALRDHRVVLLARELLPDVNKLAGIGPERLAEVAGLADAVVVEADGARGLSLKAPAAHEPVVGPATTVLMPVVAIDAVGRQLDDRIAHRPRLVSRVTGLGLGQEITTKTLAALLMHPQGALKGVPVGCRVEPLVNKTESPRALRDARQVAAEVKAHDAIAGVLVGAVARADPVRERWRKVSAVVLAAGASTRFGSPKQLARVRGKVLLRHTLDALRPTGVDEVVVVLGHAADEIAAQVPKWCRTVLNVEWEQGISSSVRTGIEAMNHRSEAALFVLGDQPHVGRGTIEPILLAYYGSTHPIIVPTRCGRRGSPVLFDRQLFPMLEGLRGDIGGRQLLDARPEYVQTVELEDEDAFFDIDIPADLERYRAHPKAKEQR
jgi:molybdenum cofactor cytidylyltransferase